jgi:hypothetical protein
MRPKTFSRTLSLAMVSLAVGLGSFATAPAWAGSAPATRAADAEVTTTSLGTNLIVNGNAEAGAGSADGSTGGTPVPGWTVNANNSIVNRYGIPSPFIQAGNPGPASRGNNYFAGGPANEFSSLKQIINVADQGTLIDTGRLRYTLSGWLGGISAQNDYAIVSIIFKDAQGQLISDVVIGPVLNTDRQNVTRLLYRELTGDLPGKTRSIEVYLNFTAQSGGYNDGIADNLSLSLFDAAPPTSSLPPALYRRALQHLEAMRGSPLAPGWDSTVRLSPVAYPLFRPDLGEQVAYYDIPVEKPTIGAQSGDAFVPATPAGFIVVSTGEHDFPISHWNYEGDSPVQELTRKAFQIQATPLKFFRMDALYYIAQNAQGSKVAENGTPINRIAGQTPFLNANTPLTTQEWQPIGNGNDVPILGASAAGVNVEISHTLIVTGPLAGTFTLTGWTSLDEMKDGYAGAYGPMIDSLKNQASSDWAVEKTAATFGEALRKGDVYTLPLLTAGNATFSGVGVGYIQTDLLAGPNGLPQYRITVLNDEAGKELPFTATISSPPELVRFIIIPPQNRAFLPSVLNKTAPAEAMRAQGEMLPMAPQVPQSVNATEGWGPWNYFWAGNSGDQRIYGQISSGTAPNNSSCPSGCGGTAWAMLFGWADHQAELGAPYWSLRRGIYRVGGGYGANADAPASMDAGVRAMTWEIRNRVGTFCAFGSGPTLPWNMSNAQGYLTNRSYAHVSTHYNVLGWHEDRLRNYARDSIINRRTPAVIGTGWLTHYPLAWGYAWRSRPIRTCIGPDLGFNCWNSTEYARFFYVNQGWPGNGSNFGWVSAGTWFAGELYP